jgi:outer membrane protein X
MNTKKTFRGILTTVLTMFIFNVIQAQMTLGGGLAYGTEIENLGIDVTGQYFINDNIAIEGSFTYYLPKDFGNGLGNDYKIKWYEINADVNYYFSEGNVSPYGVGGLNMAFVSVPYVDVNDYLGGGDGVSYKTNSEIGLNLGVGADFDLGSNITPFGQIKYVLGDADQLQILGGVRFDL